MGSQLNSSLCLIVGISWAALWSGSPPDTPPDDGQPRGTFFSLDLKHLQVSCPSLCWPPPASFTSKRDRHVHRAIYLTKISLRYNQLGYKAYLHTQKGAQRHKSSWRHPNSTLTSNSEAHQRPTSTSLEKHRGTTVSRENLN